MIALPLQHAQDVVGAERRLAGRDRGAGVERVPDSLPGDEHLERPDDLDLRESARDQIAVGIDPSEVHVAETSTDNRSKHPGLMAP